MFINPMQIATMFINGVNPKDMVLNSLRGCNFPGVENLANMIERNDVSGVEQLARNIAKEKGLNIDEMKRNLERQIGKRF